MEVKFTLTRPDAEAPAYATPGSAAADLRAALEEPLVLEPGKRAAVPTGVSIQLPDAQWVALICARSGLACRYGLALSNGVGVIDSDYRGELQVSLVNQGEEAYTIQPGERIAQLMILPVAQAAFIPAEKLDETSRGAGGFGSTGRL